MECIAAARMDVFLGNIGTQVSLMHYGVRFMKCERIYYLRLHTYLKWSKELQQQHFPECKLDCMKSFIFYLQNQIYSWYKALG